MPSRKSPFSDQRSEVSSDVNPFKPQGCLKSTALHATGTGPADYSDDEASIASNTRS